MTTPEYTLIPNLDREVCRIGLGTWAIGGWLWGGTDEREAIAAIHRALDLGINLIDTAPVYGFGLAEEIVGKALKTTSKKAVISTKAGLNWESGHPQRDFRKERVRQEVEDSLKRLQVEKIDLYHIHWPDLNIPFSEQAEILSTLLKEGKIGAIGVSNFTPEMMDEFRKFAPIHVLQSPYNLFEQEMDLAYCQKHGIVTLGYGVLCRGLLSGRMSVQTEFPEGDLRKLDPKFQEPCYSHYLACVEKLRERAGPKSLVALAIRWSLDRGVDIPLWGVRRPEHLAQFDQIWGWKLSESDMEEIDRIVTETVLEPLSSEFMAPK